MSLHVPLEALLKARPGSGSITEVRSVPCYYSGSDFRFRVPPAPGLTLEPGAHDAVVLESENEIALVTPATPDLVEGLKTTAADPLAWKAWYEAWSLALSSRAVTIHAATGPEGETLLSALVHPGEEAADWQSTLSSLYRLDWNGREVWVILAARRFGGPGRLASALSEEEAARGPLLKLSRGNLHWAYTEELRGDKGLDALARMGLSRAAVSTGDLRHWEELAKWRDAHPGALTLLSANLVYSSATTTTLFPAYDVVEAGGLKVAVIGVTPEAAAKYLAPAGLTNVSFVDPHRAVSDLMGRLRPTVDVVVLLGELEHGADFGDARLRGVDLALARYEYQTGWLPPQERVVQQRERAPFQVPLLFGRAHRGALPVFEASVAPASRGRKNWTVRERHVQLDDSVPDAAGFPRFDLSVYGITLSTEPPLLPAASRIFGEPPGSPRRLDARDFWTLAASLVADKTDAEVALLPVSGLATNVPGDVSETIVRSWLETGESLETRLLKGSELKPLLAEAEIQRQRENQDKGDAALPFTAGGAGPDFQIHGAPVDDNQMYRVTTSRVLADALSLPSARRPAPIKEPLDPLVLDALRERRDAPPEQLRRWVEGRAVSERGLWTVNFRDVGLNIQNTKVVRGDEFDAVPNSRVQGFDELLIGGVFKTDADYVKQPFRWSNTLEMEYARSRLRPRNAPPVTNTTANRIFAVTTGTRRAGAIQGGEWLARSWGPSLGFAYEGQFESAPGLRRRQIYSAYPGLSFYDGTWVRNFEISGNVKRDLSRDPANTQTGLHTRLIVSKDLGAAPVRLQAEMFTNYFFLTKQDTPQDLRVEGDVSFKLRVPIRKHLSLAPFIDFYYFQLKTRPSWGYSAMTGVSLGFSRLWKPQYEGLLGER